MNFSNPETVAALCQKSVHPDGGTIADQVRRFLSGAQQSPYFVKTFSGYAFAAPGYHEAVAPNIAQEVIFAAQQIIARPFQRLSGRQMLNFVSAHAAPKSQYSLFFNSALGFSFIGMSDGQSEAEAILKYHSRLVGKALSDMRRQANAAVRPSRSALDDAVLYSPQLNSIYKDEIALLRDTGGPLYKFRVAYVDSVHESDVLFFECDAEDYEHAMEQAHSSYPDAVLLHAYEPAAELIF